MMLKQNDPDETLYIFGYGSLMWRPGFEYLSARHGQLHGYHRCFCVYSHVHRGTRARPGLVLGLDRGGSVRGIVFQVAASQADAVRANLRAREQVTLVYREAMLRVVLQDGRRVLALCYVADRRHQQYAGKLPFETQLDLIAHGAGESGANPDYLAQTLAQLEEMGISDRKLRHLHHAVQARLAVSRQAT